MYYVLLMYTSTYMLVYTDSCVCLLLLLLFRFQEVSWQNIEVGDLVLLQNNDFVTVRSGALHLCVHTVCRCVDVLSRYIPQPTLYTKTMVFKLGLTGLVSKRPYLVASWSVVSSVFLVLVRPVSNEGHP